MHTILRRWASRSSLPHPLFEEQSSLFKPDPYTERLMRDERKRRRNMIQPEPIDFNSVEYNADTTKMYDVTPEDIQQYGDPIHMYFKLYANKYPEEILDRAVHYPQLQFNKELQKLQDFSKNYTISEMRNNDHIDTRYVVSRFCPPYFKILMDIVMSKIPMFGITVPMSEYEQLERTDAELDKEIFIFHFGGGAFFDINERNLYRWQLIRQTGSRMWLDNRTYPFVTEAEDNFLLGMMNWPGSDDKENRFTMRPYFRVRDI